MRGRATGLEKKVGVTAQLPFFSESDSDMFFCFCSHFDYDNDLNMQFARHIRYPLTVSSKPEVNDTVIALLDQIDELTKQFSLVTEQKDRLQEENFDQVIKPTDQNSLLADQNAQLQNEKMLLLCSVFQNLNEAWV